MAYKIGDNTVIDDNRALTAVGVTAATNLNIPSGNTASRPTGAVGKLYFDTDLGKLLVHNGTAWIVAGSTEKDVSKHTQRFLMYSNNGGGGSHSREIFIAPYNEMVQYISRDYNHTTNGLWDWYVKLKSMPNEITLSTGEHGSAALHSDMPLLTSLDNKAVTITIGGGPDGSGSKNTHAFIFDSTYDDSFFRISSSTGQTALGMHAAKLKIYKYSDTVYVTWLHNHVRVYNPSNVTEGTEATPVFNLTYTVDDNSLGEGDYNIFAVWKSSTANCITVLAGNKSRFEANTNNNVNTYYVYDIDITDGSINGTAKSFQTIANESISHWTHPYIETTTHVVFMCYRANNYPYRLYRWKKSDRTIQQLYSPNQYGSESWSGHYASIFKMNDKVYSWSKNSKASNGYQGTYMYEITDSTQNGYWYLQNVDSSKNIIHTTKDAYNHKATYSTDTFTWKSYDGYDWTDSQGSESAPMQYVATTVNLETSKTTIHKDNGYDNMES